MNRDVVTRPGYVLSPDEKISVETAIRAVTSVPAWQMFSEGELGSLEAGKLADLVILASDPRKVESENIGEIKGVGNLDRRQARLRAEGGNAAPVNPICRFRSQQKSV